MTAPVDISIIIPAFNEEKRLPFFLDKVISYCQKSQKVYEIIVVDDGSRDGTFRAASFFQERFPRLSVLKLHKNQGKGHATKAGLLKAAGRVALFLDADGSVEPDEIERNLKFLTNEDCDIFIGSRVLKDKDQILEVKWYRKWVGAVFNFLVRTLLFKDIKDTQCGFKMFKSEAVKPLFSRVYLNGFGFDIEILYLAKKMGYKIKEGPVSWHNVSGSKVNLFKDSLRMFFNILQIRNWHCTPVNAQNQYLGPDEYQYMYDMEQSHWWFVSHRELAAHLIRSFGLGSPKILDVGTGTGGKLLFFKQFGEVAGVDVSEKAVEFCRKRGLTEVLPCPAEKMIFQDKSFDIITCLDVLEHVTDPVEVLRELKRVLKDEGRLIVTVPAFKILWSQHDDALCHLRRYRSRSLRNDLEEAGFKAEKVSHLFFTSFFVVAPIRLFRRFLKPNFKSDTTTLPPKFLNEALKTLFRAEIAVSTRLGLPLGTTLYAVASKC